MNQNTKRLTKLILRKLLEFILVMFLLSVIVFYMSRLAPGDPLKSYYGESVERMSTAQQEAARERLGLSDPIYIQYGKWLTNAAEGDFGISYKYKQDAAEVIEGVWINTLVLGGVSYVLTFVLALLLGMFCALHEDRFVDKVICKIGTVTNCIPSFFVALVLILIFGVNLAWLPTSGAYALGQSGNFGDRVIHLLLPVTVLLLSHLWYYTYMIRNKLLEETRRDYVLLCKVKGLSRRQIMWKHCLKNIMPAFISIMAISVPHILGGTYVVEKVFSYPGLGSLSFESAQFHDYNMLLLLCLITGALVVFFNMAAQVLSEMIDPRMRLAREDLE